MIQITYMFFIPIWFVIGAVHLSASFFPNGRPDWTAVRFHVGLDGAGKDVPFGKGPLKNAGGDLPDIRLWNEVGEGFATQDRSGRAKHGTFSDVWLQSGAGGQPTYALLTAKNDAVCLALLTVTWANGGHYAWNGDWAYVCGHPWYYSNIYIDEKPLRCAWMDANGDQPVTGIALHLPSFRLKKGQKTPAVKPYCAQNPTQTFRYDPKPQSIWIWSQRKAAEDSVFGEAAKEIYKTTREGRPKTRRSTRYPNAHRIVRSTKKAHSARELCASESSYGPDLVSYEEGTFCDMDSRQVYDLCVNDETDCFDAEERVIRTSKEGILKRGEPIKKAYSRVLDW